MIGESVILSHERRSRFRVPRPAYLRAATSLLLKLPAFRTAPRRRAVTL